MSLRSVLSGLLPARVTGARAGMLNVAGDAVSRKEGLGRDDRGVIMVVGIMFTFLWVGLAWAIFGIGNAIAYRENLQNAADAAAFAGAVYDARGMNMLASINIIMGVILSILILAHLVQVAILVVESIACWICIPDPFCGYGWADCPGLCSAQSDINSFVSDVDTVVHDILPILHDLEVVVAVGWPWVAAGKSSTLSAWYYSHGVQLASTFAYSQIPWSLDTDVSSLTGNLGGLAGVGSKDQNSKNTRYGLPVTSDSYSNLCKVGFVDATSLEGLIPVPGFIDQFLNYAGNWFCDAGADSPDVTYAIEAISDVALPCVVYGFGSPFSSLPPSDNTDGVGVQAGDSALVKGSDKGQSPMKLYPPKMGLDYYGVWSTAVGQFTDVTTNRVQIAGQQSKREASAHVVIDTPDDTTLSVAKAEFYYEPQNGDSSGDEKAINFDNAPNIRAAMWNLRWRARLRRYHDFPGLLGDASIGNLFSSNWKKAAVSGLAAGGEAALNGDSPADALQKGEDKLLQEYGLGGGSEPPQVDKWNKPAAGIYH